MTSNRLASRIALVTGAGRGPGQHAALALGQAGAFVAAIDLNPDAAQHTADLITQAGGQALAEAVDASNKFAMQTLGYTLLERFGRLDVLVTAAHIEPHTSALTMDEGEWNRTLDVNLKGVFIPAQIAARAMKETGGGHIFNLLRPADSPHAAVRAAREGVVGLTAALAEAWAPYGIQVHLLTSPDDLLTHFQERE